MATACLETRITDITLAVPMAAIDQVITADLLPPPPLTRPWVGGLGVIHDKAFVALDLTGQADFSAAVRLVVFHACSGGWSLALHVQDLGDIVELRTEPGNTEDPLLPWDVPREWLSPARTTDGRRRVLLDPEAAVRHLQFGPLLRIS